MGFYIKNPLADHMDPGALLAGFKTCAARSLIFLKGEKKIWHPRQESNLRRNLRRVA